MALVEETSPHQVTCCLPTTLPERQLHKLIHMQFKVSERWNGLIGTAVGLEVRYSCAVRMATVAGRYNVNNSSNMGES
jgi:hypothetical protein